MQDAVKKLSAFISSDASSVAVAVHLRERVPRAQQDAILQNSALFSLLAAQSQASGKKGAAEPAYLAATRARSDAHTDSEAAMLLAAAATARCKSLDAGIQRVTDWMKAHPNADTSRPVLLAAHLALTAQPPQTQRASELLSSELLTERARNAPALVMSRVALRESEGAGGEVSVRAELEGALQWWEAQSDSVERTRACCACLEHLSATHLRRGDTAAAKRALEQLQVRPAAHCGDPDCPLHRHTTGEDSVKRVCRLAN